MLLLSCYQFSKTIRSQPSSTRYWKVLVINFCWLTKTWSQLGLKARIARTEMQVFINCFLDISESRDPRLVHCVCWSHQQRLQIQCQLDHTSWIPSHTTLQQGRRRHWPQQRGHSHIWWVENINFVFFRRWSLFPRLLVLMLDSSEPSHFVTDNVWRWSPRFEWVQSRIAMVSHQTSSTL